MGKTSQTSKKNVVLKRSVSIRAVVTDNYRTYLNHELSQNILATQNRVAAIDQELSKLSAADQPVIGPLLIQERYRLTQNLAELKNRHAQAATLEIGSTTLQGVLEGFVTISEGDNLYEKLSSTEVLIKDGIVQSIRTIQPTALD